MTIFSPTDTAPAEVDDRPELDHLADFSARQVTNHELRQLIRNGSDYVVDGVRYRWADYDGPGTDMMVPVR